MCLILFDTAEGKHGEQLSIGCGLAGYSVNDRLLSPHHFGVPQIRERAFIVGRRGGLERSGLAGTTAGFQTLDPFSPGREFG